MLILNPERWSYWLWVHVHGRQRVNELAYPLCVLLLSVAVLLEPGGEGVGSGLGGPPCGRFVRGLDVAEGTWSSPLCPGGPWGRCGWLYPECGSKEITMKSLKYDCGRPWFPWVCLCQAFMSPNTAPTNINITDIPIHWLFIFCLSRRIITELFRRWERRRDECIGLLTGYGSVSIFNKSLWLCVPCRW